VLVLASLFLASISQLQAAEPWDFIRVGRDTATAPKWNVRSGKAEVAFRGNHIDIRVPSSEDQGPIAITGTVDPDGAIEATYTSLNTDAAPLHLRGRYMTRDELQIWGTKRKIVTQREIVFTHPPNRDFLGFLGRDVRDE